MSRDSSLAEGRPEVTGPLARYDTGATFYMAETMHAAIMNVVQRRILDAAVVQPVLLSKSTERGGFGRWSRTTRVQRRARAFHVISAQDPFNEGHQIIEVADQVTTVQKGRRGKKGTGAAEVVGNTVTLTQTQRAMSLGLVAVQRNSYQISTGSPEVKRKSELLVPIHADQSGVNQLDQGLIYADRFESRKTEAIEIGVDNGFSTTQQLMSMVGLLRAIEGTVIARADNPTIHEYIDMVTNPVVSRVNGQRLALDAPSPSSTNQESSRHVIVAPVATLALPPATVGPQAQWPSIVN